MVDYDIMKARKFFTRKEDLNSFIEYLMKEGSNNLLIDSIDKFRLEIVQLKKSFKGSKENNKEYEMLKNGNAELKKNLLSINKKVKKNEKYLLVKENLELKNKISENMVERIL